MGLARTLRLSIAAAVGAAAAAAFAPSAGAVSCVPADPVPGDTVTCTFSYTGAAESWVVPAVVTSATFDVWGAAGGRGLFQTTVGGRGAHVQATLGVTPGETLVVSVGGAGAVAGTAGAGGFNGGGAGGTSFHTSAGGGGASDVRDGVALADRLLVAGGGGGGGYEIPSSGTGGNGGDSGTAGTNGGNDGPAGGGGGGGAGTGSGDGAAGAAGVAVGSCSSFTQGAAGAGGALGLGGHGGNADEPGGGGGGGYYGGGGGGASFGCASPIAEGGGGGGGGGSSYADPAATGVTIDEGARTGNGLITVTYTVPDDTSPVITPTIVGTQGTNGWYRSDVSITWDVQDPDSPISSTSGCGPVSLTTETSGTNVQCQATSAGGTSIVLLTIKIDKTNPTLAPTVTPNPVTQGEPATASPNASDALSGIASQSCPQPDTSFVGLGVIVCSATDAAGNTAFGQASYSVVDGTSPEITPTVTGTPGNGGWYTSNVAVTWTVTDPDSQVTSTSGCDPVQLTTDTAGTQVQCQATSGGGTTISLLIIKIDQTDPLLAPTVTPNPVAQGGAATASANATDATSGVASQGCETPSTAAVGPAAVNCTATDNAGNTTNAQAAYTVVPACNGLAATIVGGPGDTTITGTSGNDVIVDTTGTNTITAGSGNDTICTGTGADKIDAGAGDDWVDAGAGKNVVKGVDGKDTITSGSGDDNVDGGNGNDAINAGEGGNKVTGGDGDDQLTAGAGDDQIDGGKNVDTCSPGLGSNKVKNCEILA